MIKNQFGFSLIETMLAVLVTGICILGVIKFMVTSQRSLTQSMGSLQAQASAEELMQQIRLMRWDQNKLPGIRMSLSVAPVPSVTCSPCNIPPQTLEDWAGYSDVDNSRPDYGPFQRSVQVNFVRLTAENVLDTSTTPQEGKKVTVWAVGRTSATVSSVFYNLP